MRGTPGLFKVSRNVAIVLRLCMAFTIVFGTHAAESANQVAAQSLIAPDQPILINPSNGATGVSLSPALTVSVSDPENEPLNVEFYGRPKSTQTKPFSLVLLPDTQWYTDPASQPLGASIFNQQTSWIVANQTSRNIVFVNSLGDITQNGSNDTDDSEWQIADAAYDILDAGGVPYNVAIGNHDLVGGSAKIEQWFGISRFQGRSYYGGYYPGVAKNYINYNLFSASGVDFILINLSCPMAAPSPDSLAWANQLLKSNPERRGIVVCHDLLTQDIQPLFRVPGQATYDALKGNPNLFLLLGGHYPTDGSRSDTYNGNTVYSMRSDYSGQWPYGNGWLRILEFQPANNQIQVITYSPYRNLYRTLSTSQFSVPYDMGPAWELIKTETSVASGSTVNVNWTGLDPNTQYEWRTVVSDGTLSTTSPTWTFTTANSANLSPVITEGDLLDVSLSENGDPTPFNLTLHATDENIGDTLTWKILIPALHGTAGVSAPNTGTSAEITYSPNLDYSGVDSFAVQVADGSGGWDTIKVNLAIIPNNTPPLPPTGLTAIGANTIVNLSWNANTEPDLVGYNVYLFEAPSSYIKLNPSLLAGSAYTAVGLTNGASYSFVVTAVDSLASESNYSASASGTPVDISINGPPNPPVLVGPADGATDVTTPVLSVNVTDPEGQPMDVSFYGRPAQDTPSDPFSLVILPDTQFLALSWPNIFNAQTQWVADNTSDNIVFVGNLGDIVNEEYTPQEWVNATAAYDILTAHGVPYGLALGNHDGAPSNTGNFNANFSARLASQTTYGGRYGSSDYDNTYSLFTASGIKFIVIFIEYDTTMTTIDHPVLQWANALLQNNPDLKGIVISHNMIQGGTSDAFSTQGQTIYNALRENSNLFLMMGGHNEGASRRSDIYNGNTVFTLRSDYQAADNQQSGYLRILQFVPAENSINVRTYSPNQDKLYDKLDVDQNIFSLPFDMGGFELIGTVNDVSSGANAALPWNELSVGQKFEWYVTVSDHTDQTASSTWTFTHGTGSVAPIILTDPTDQAVMEGQTASFSASASGSPTPSVQWQVSLDGSSWADIGQATTLTYSFTAQMGDNANLYRAVFSNSAGTVTTKTARLTVTATESAPVVTTQPVDISVTAGSTAVFSAAASGTPTPSVQWQVSSDGSNWADIGEATTLTYSFTSQLEDNSNLYRAVFTNSAGTAVTDAAQLTVTPSESAPVIITQPINLSVTAGATAAFDAAASGTPSPSVQWQSSPDGYLWTDIVGAVSTSYSFIAQLSDNAKQYRAVFTNSAGSATTQAAMLTVAAPDTPPVILTQPADLTVVEGVTVSFTASASGSPMPDVQWQSSSDGNVWSDIIGAISTSYSFTAHLSDDASLFRAVFSNSAGTAATNAAMLTVKPADIPPTILTHPVDQVVSEGEIASFDASASGFPVPILQWQVSSDGSTWTDIMGATTSPYSFTAELGDNAKFYRAVFSNSAGSVGSEAARLTVNSATTPPEILTHPGYQIVVAGETASFSASASGTPTPSVQWQVSSDGYAWSNIADATSLTYSFTAQMNDDGLLYRAFFTNSAGSAASDSALLTVNTDLIFADDFNICDVIAWSGGAINREALFISEAGGRNSSCGMAVSIINSAASYVIDPSPNAESQFRARFYFNPNTLKMASNDLITIYEAYNNLGAGTAVVQIRYSAKSYQLRAGMLRDNQKWSYTNWSPITKAWHSVEFNWNASLTGNVSTGSLVFYIDGIQKTALNAIDNDQQQISQVALGVVRGMDNTASGSCFFDDYESRQNTTIGP